jgi:hypothetical protein
LHGHQLRKPKTTFLEAMKVLPLYQEVPSKHGLGLALGVVEGVLLWSCPVAWMEYFQPAFVGNAVQSA